MTKTTEGRRTVSVPAVSAVLVASVFHYAGPSAAVLLFAHVGPLGVAWLRLASAALVLGIWRRPWRVWRQASGVDRRRMLAWGAVLAGMNTAFYLALDCAPLATVASIEFLGVLALAACGARTPRNLGALLVAAAGVAVLIRVSIAGSVAGLAWSTLNCVGFVMYVVLGHRVATTRRRGTERRGADGRPGAEGRRADGRGTDDRRADAGGFGGADTLAMAVVVAACVAAPIGLGSALPAFTHPSWLAWAAAVGICSTVIPYVADQVAMARLPRATYALLLALLPVTATVCGLVVLGQVPSPLEFAGILAVGAAIAVHRPADAGAPDRTPSRILQKG